MEPSLADGRRGFHQQTPNHLLVVDDEDSIMYLPTATIATSTPNNHRYSNGSSNGSGVCSAGISTTGSLITTAPTLPFPHFPPPPDYPPPHHQHHPHNHHNHHLLQQQNYIDHDGGSSSINGKRVHRYPDESIDSIELCLEPEPQSTKSYYNTLGGSGSGVGGSSVGGANGRRSMNTIGPGKYYNDVDPQVNKIFFYVSIMYT